MPSADQHRNKAARNRAFLDSISLDEYSDWVAVAAFYTAVHHMERLRAAAGHGDSTDHEDRLKYVQHNLPSHVHSAYYILQNVSMLARYQSVADFFRQFQPADVRDKLVNDRLAQIEQYVSNTLPSDATPPRPPAP